ncbi:hypothetical protein [Umezakia ovalisporum]|uniref:hypothetical protein n=1 Tax=Umezakia ovalisporum TaxID=75695 RepID=UPI0024770593|nr:hypothetical protein [Umezakia ovalisporum]MBI1240310.1 hypothetical protein [Nostoc sp. RI_552]MDH6086804.1 hypothetical protein [Umezakia ovalisporum Ak1311]
MESLNSDNSLQPEQPSCPFYSILPPDNMANRQLPLLKPAAAVPPGANNGDLQQDTNDSDWVVEPNSEQQILADTEFKKLLALNEELRTANNHLYEEVEHLKDDLAESEKALQWQKRRSSVAESMVNQQTKELAASQEQIKSLFQELEASVQTIKRQENFIETYKAQLQISQQRLAHLERECALLQANYNEQSQLASQSENTCRELRSRLMRQQRQTLQFKAALEKCLETPGFNDCSEETTNHQTRFSRKARSLFPNVQPIRPWSTESESHSFKFDFPENQSVDPPSELSRPPINSNHNSESIVSWPEKLPITENTPVSSQPGTSEVEESTTTSETISSLGSSKLDAQLDSLIQMFFTIDSAPASPPPPEINVETNQTEAPVGETKVTTFKNTEESLTSAKSQLEILTGEEDFIASPVNNSPESLTLPWEKTNVDSSSGAGVAQEDCSSTNSQLHRADLSSDYYGDYAKDTQSPSPVVYPQRPPKGRKSLSSVQLPDFRPNNQYSNPQ